ncbi:MAG TPA: efflux RND transporter periplasmic adaptor subunit [Spirochaetota bacterium]|nr:efflux RND transporter periplasmic adaptor subunit [Spirochaetota bacterium]HPS86384.1 efflux RND transporter periplasmic adaptor subunit [Spirochaetota bacterium]
MKIKKFLYLLNEKMSLKNRLIAVVLIFVTTGGIIYGVVLKPEIISGREAALAKKPINESISTIIAEGKEVRDTIQVLGQIVFKEKVNISSKVSGRLSKIYIKEGKRVGRGELIAEIERLPFEITFKQQQSELEIAKKALELSEAKYSDALKGIEIKFKTIKKAKADLNDKKVSYENMNSVLKNKTELFKAGGISNTELESIKTQHTTLRTKYELAKSDYEIQLVGYRDKDITSEGIKLPDSADEKIRIFKEINTKIEKAELESAKSRVRQAQSSLLSSELLLKETYIRSPITGVIAVRNMEGGEMVKEDSVISTVMDISSVFISMNLNEKDITKVKPGQKVKFSVDAFNIGKFFTGSIDTVSPVLDTRTRSVEVKAAVSNISHELLPGMFARAVIDTGKSVRGILIPKSAVILHEDGRSEIYTVKNGLVVKENIVTGSEYGEEIQIIEGVKEGDRVVVSGLNSVYQGMKIE